MSCPPFFVEYVHPEHALQVQLADKHIELALGLSTKDFLKNLALPQNNQHHSKPWRNLQAASLDVGSKITIKEEKDKFQVNLDVQHFAPEEISVRTVDGYLVIEANHEERQDEHGYISRRFCRKYSLPEGIEADAVISRLSSDGVLTITAPQKAPKASNERIVPIVQTGPVKKKVEDGAGEQPGEQQG